MKSDFEIPIDIKNDLVYCQRALTNHILVHQVNVCYEQIILFRFLLASLCESYERSIFTNTIRRIYRGTMISMSSTTN